LTQGCHSRIARRLAGVGSYLDDLPYLVALKP
jgi:hypothetical protein